MLFGIYQKGTLGESGVKGRDGQKGDMGHIGVVGPRGFPGQDSLPGLPGAPGFPGKPVSILTFLYAIAIQMSVIATRPFLSHVVNKVRYGLGWAIS